MARTRSRILRWGTRLLLLAAGLVYAFWPRPVAVDLGAVTAGPLSVTIDEEGETRVKDVYVVSAPLAGRLLRIEQDVGDPVAAAKTLVATIRPQQPTLLDVRSEREAEAAVKAAEAGLELAVAERERARAELRFSENDLERAQRLAERGNIAARALDQARLNVKTRQAAVAAADATVQVRRFELETVRAQLITPGSAAQGDEARCCVELRAPIDGRILKIMRESESVVAAGEPLVEIGDPARLEIVADLLSSDAVRVDDGDPVMIEEWGGGAILNGTVRRVEPSGFTKVSALGIEEQRVNVIIDFTDPHEAWRRLGHGYRVEVRIVVWHADKVLRVPIGALFRDGADWAVFVAENGRAALRHVTLGERNSESAELRDGLADGARVVLHPSDRIADGTRIVERGI